MVEMRGFVEKKQSPVMSPAKKFLNKDSEKKLLVIVFENLHRDVVKELIFECCGYRD